MLKNACLQSRLRRQATMKVAPDRHVRPAVFLCDEYQAFVSGGEPVPATRDPPGHALVVDNGAVAGGRGQFGQAEGESQRTTLAGKRFDQLTARSRSFSAEELQRTWPFLSGTPWSEDRLAAALIAGGARCSRADGGSCSTSGVPLVA